MNDHSPVYTEKRRLLFAALPLTLTHYEIRDNTLSEQTGLFAVTVKSVAAEALRSIEVRQSRIQLLLGLCTVHVATSDPNLPEFVIHNIRKDTAFSAKLAEFADRNSALRPLGVE